MKKFKAEQEEYDQKKQDQLEKTKKRIIEEADEKVKDFDYHTRQHLQQEIACRLTHLEEDRIKTLQEAEQEWLEEAKRNRWFRREKEGKGRGNPRKDSDTIRGGSARSGGLNH